MAKGHHTLVCAGQPGAGKIIIAATFIHELHQIEDTADLGVAHLFCNYTRQDEQDIKHLLAALVRQLLHSKDTIPDSIETTYSKHKARKSRRS